MWCCAGCFASSWRRCEASSVSYRWAGEALGFLLVSRYGQQLHVACSAVCLFMGPFPTRHTCNSSLSCVHMAIRQQMTLKGIGKLAFLLPKFFFCNVCFRLKESIGCIWSFSVSWHPRDLFICQVTRTYLSLGSEMGAVWYLPLMPFSGHFV